MSDDAGMMSPSSQDSLTSTVMKPPEGAPQIPGYRMQRRLGSGGMATVWLAVQESLDREVAIKVMSHEALADESAKKRFEQEARTIARLEHPGIVGIHEVGRTEDGQPYYVMPYLARGALSQRDYQGDEEAIFEILRALLSALEYAHARGIVHRDVKSENVLFDASNRPRLTDFGIALTKRTSARITTAGLALGSGGYMSPEQARGEEVDGRADLYSLGVMAYELLVGVLPYDASEPLALALMHAQDPIPRLPTTLRHWQGFIDKAMAKGPQDRFRNASQMLRALERLELRRESASAERWARLWAMSRLQLHRARPALYFTGGLAGALVLVWAVWTLLPQGGPASPANDTLALAQPEDGTLASDESDGADAESSGATAVQGLIARGEEQLAAGDLLAPGDANAADTWTEAWRQAPDNPAVVDGLERTLAALATRVAANIAARNPEQAQTGFARARELATSTGLSTGEAWREFRATVREALATRLRAAAANFDHADGVATSELVATIDPSHPELLPLMEPLADLPRPGQALEGGLPLVFVAPGAPGRPALAAMSRPVTQGEYGAFATGTSRGSANCHLPASLVRVFARKTWRDPPFEQSSDHPVVCVSHDDAASYAQWLGARSGMRLQLPSAADWRRMTAGMPAGQCGNARLACGDTRGTLGVARFGANGLGLRDLNGNVAEWLRDCAGDCSRHLVGGQSWRDAPGERPSQTRDFPAERGHQEVGFRLVRELRPGDNVRVRQ